MQLIYSLSRARGVVDCVTERLSLGIARLEDVGDLVADVPLLLLDIQPLERRRP